MREPTIEEIANSKVMEEVFHNLRDSLAMRFFTTPLNDTDGLKLIRLTSHAADEVERFIRSYKQAEEIEENGARGPTGQ